MLTCEFENGTKTKLRHVVADVILINKDEILLVKRGEGSFAEAGKWALPGGFVDRDETTAEAARREVMEETGYDSGDYKFLTYVDSPRRRNDKPQNIAFIYTAKPLEKKAEPDHEIDEIKWFPLDSLPSKEEMAFDHYELINSYKNDHVPTS